MADPIDLQPMSHDEAAPRLADISRQMADVGAELRALSPSAPSGDVAAAIRPLSRITDQHTPMLES
jgi:hypothetical protein